MSEMAYPMDPGTAMGIPRKEGMIDRTDGLLNELVGLIELLEHTLSPIRSVGPDTSEKHPTEAPANRMHEFIIRLEHANMRLRVLNAELHL